MGTESLVNHVNAANPSTLADHLRRLGFGSILRAAPTTLRRRVPAADANNLATVQSLGTALDGKANTILSAYARATSGAGTLGELVIDASRTGTAPADGHIVVAPNGEILVLASSAYTDVDVTYVPEKYDVAVLPSLPVVTNVLTLPASVITDPVTGNPKGAVMILNVVAAGGAPGTMRILAPGAGAPSAGQCRLNVAKTTVTFAGADAITSAIVTLGVVPAIDVDAVLEADATTA